MKPLVAFLLALQVLGSSLLPGFGIDQSARLVDLAKHYQQHRAMEPKLSFLDFMAMHYSADSDHQKHPKHSHHNLPAAGHPATAFTVPSIILLSLASLSMFFLAKTGFFRYANLYSFISISSLINPPRR